MNNGSLILAEMDEGARKEYWSTLALRCSNGLGKHHIIRLLREYGSAYEAIQQVESWPTKIRSRDLRSNGWRTAAKIEWDRAFSLGCQIILWSDSRYPELLREISDAPALLYALGDISLLKNPCIAVVGSRESGIPSLQFSLRLASELSMAGITVVSGLALGIDAEAHRGALPYPGSTIAVLAGGVDVPTPACNGNLYNDILKKGLILSEYAPGLKPIRPNYHTRNRIISGLSKGIVVAEALQVKSGSLITARYALDQNRSVYTPAQDAFQGTPGEGRSSLLDQGAMPIYNAENIIHDLLPQLKAMVPPKDKIRVQEQTLLSFPDLTMPDISEEKYGEKESDNCNSTKINNKEPSKEEEIIHSDSDPLRRFVFARVGKPREHKTPLPEAPSNLSDTEKAILRVLSKNAVASDELLFALQDKDPLWNVAKLNTELLKMEVKKLIKRGNDSRYTLACTFNDTDKD